MITAKVILASKPIDGGPILYTVECRYPRFIHSEIMTHRKLSRNASSSRAIPVKRMLAQVWSDPAMPVHWGSNQPGMQAKTELDGFKRTMAETLWRVAGKVACVFAWGMVKCNLHKQVANRILEPWQYISVIITSTEWENFFQLRDHPDAQPEIQALAKAIRAAMAAATPVPAREGYWHLPYIFEEDRNRPLRDLVRMSAARCARVSYLTHDGSCPVPEQDFKLYDRLVGSHPMHASPIEHQACYRDDNTVSNLVGWSQYRKMVEYDIPL